MTNPLLPLAGGCACGGASRSPTESDTDAIYDDGTHSRTSLTADGGAMSGPSEQPTTAATLPEPVKRYRRVVDRLECPICGERLGERYWDSRIHDWGSIAYQDSGPTYYLSNVIDPRVVRTFKPCGCETAVAWQPEAVTA